VKDLLRWRSDLAPSESILLKILLDNPNGPWRVVDEYEDPFGVNKRLLKKDLVLIAKVRNIHGEDFDALVINPHYEFVRHSKRVARYRMRTSHPDYVPTSARDIARLLDD